MKDRLLRKEQEGYYIYVSEGETLDAEVQKTPPTAEQYHAVILISDMLPSVTIRKGEGIPMTLVTGDRERDTDEDIAPGDKRDTKGTSQDDSSLVPVRDEVRKDFWGYPKGAPPLDLWEDAGNQKQRKLDWRGRRITIQWSKQRLTVSLASSDLPLSVPELDAYCSALEMLFYPDFEKIPWTCILLGVGFDFGDMKMAWDAEGNTKKVTYRDIRTVISTWYDKNKIKVLRRENHAVLHATLPELIQNLRGRGQPGVSEMISAIKKELKDTRQLMYEVLNAVRRVERVETKLITTTHDIEKRGKN
jgi:hypothetical protein